ncbi:MAG: PIG-L family deacetylase [Alphaproteobacteria bacterium]|nr:PIG-L family deacetylase [Alphaproteobacteria bacterium]
MNIMAIGAHPDDIEIFMYGLLAAAKTRGDDITLVVATDGAAGGATPGAELAAQRADETRKGLAELGVPRLLGLPDGGLATAPDAAAEINKVIRQAAPDLIITHGPEDYHPDHRALSKYVTDAAGFRCPILFADTLMGVGFAPDYYVDITSYAEAKTRAIMAHDSQQPARFAEAARIMNRFRSAQCNGPDGHFAEAYRMDRRFPFTDIRAMLPDAPPYRPFYVPDSDALI